MGPLRVYKDCESRASHPGGRSIERPWQDSQGLGPMDRPLAVLPVTDTMSGPQGRKLSHPFEEKRMMKRCLIFNARN